MIGFVLFTIMKWLLFSDIARFCLFTGYLVANHMNVRPEKSLSYQLNDLNSKSIVPLFQLYSFLTRPPPFTLKGPCSMKAPYPKEEQPGPTLGKKKRKGKTKYQYN